jgi:D-arabinose 5-phosphate isomerase GutQ
MDALGEAIFADMRQTMHRRASIITTYESAGGIVLQETLLELIRNEELLQLPDPALPTGLRDLALRGKGPPPEHDRELPVSPVDFGTHEALVMAIRARVWSIGFAIHNTIVTSRTEILAAVAEIHRWITSHEIVRVVGAGRARLAAAIPANRLAHCGARVFVQHDIVPMPNSLQGGSILAASASGKTESVLSLLDTARRRNSTIRILGIANKDASEFKKLCHIFVGIDETRNPYNNPLQALADTGEYIISELLDAMVVAAAKRAGLTDEDFRKGHEDLGDTGPYLPRGDRSI